MNETEEAVVELHEATIRALKAADRALLEHKQDYVAMTLLVIALIEELSAAQSVDANEIAKRLSRMVDKAGSILGEHGKTRVDLTLLDLDRIANSNASGNHAQPLE